VNGRARRIGAIAAWWAATWIVMFAIWMLLVDRYPLDEMVTGVVCATIAAVGSELVRAQRLAEIKPRARWLLRSLKPVARAPRDVGIVLGAILRQVVERRPQRGRLRALPFRHGGDGGQDHARRALAEAMGSFAPNAIVVGIDPDRDVILVHQLSPRGDAASELDPIDLR